MSVVGEIGSKNNFHQNYHTSGDRKIYIIVKIKCTFFKIFTTFIHIRRSVYKSIFPNCAILTYKSINLVLKTILGTKSFWLMSQLSVTFKTKSRPITRRRITRLCCHWRHYVCARALSPQPTHGEHINICHSFHAPMFSTLYPKDVFL